MPPPLRRWVITVSKYIIIKQFRDPSGIRFPGEIIELTPSRAAVFRESGLIGAEYVQPDKLEPKQDPAPTVEIEHTEIESPKEAPKPQKKGQRKAGK